MSKLMVHAPFSAFSQILSKQHLQCITWYDAYPMATRSRGLEQLGGADLGSHQPAGASCTTQLYIT